MTRLREWVRGCVALMIMTSTAAAQDLPSGQAVHLDEVLIDRVGEEDWLRFRFLTPDIARDGGTVSYAAAEQDFAVLCETVARPYISEHALRGDVIVVSLMDRPVPFGQADPDATQFFEAFRIEDGTCVWQAF